MDHKLPFIPRPLVLSRGSTSSCRRAYKLLDFIYILLFMYDFLCGAFFNLISSVLAGGQSMAEVWGLVQCSWAQLCVRGSGSSEHRPFYYSSPRARVHSCGLELDCIILLTYPELQCPVQDMDWGMLLHRDWFVCLIFTRVCSLVQRLAAKNMDSPHCLEASNFEITLKW